MSIVEVIVENFISKKTYKFIQGGEKKKNTEREKAQNSVDRESWS